MDTGRLFLSEVGRQLCLHELALSPKSKIQRIMKLPSPEPDLGERHGIMQHGVIATWAPDDTTVSLRYIIESNDDARGDDVGVFQVPSTL